jgi:Acetyl-CoA acetyltransferase
MGTTHNAYGMCAMRHMHDYGTTSEQLAWIKVAASHHAQYNPHAMLKESSPSRTCSTRR